jgi:tRNA (cmo5U34)-methyltransferase
MNEEAAGWHGAEAARTYRSVADLVAPGRRDILNIIARAAREFGAERPRVLDLGGGYGEVTASIVGLTPAAEICLLDFSDEMLAMAGERFAGTETVTVRKHDLEKGLPKDLKTGDYDAVVSCFALHHVAFKRRVPLYRDILAALKPGGVFVNGDRFTGESPSISEWELDNWIAWMVAAERRETGVERTFEDVKA